MNSLDKIEAVHLALEEKQKQEYEKIKNAVDAVFNTEAGILFGRYLVNVLNVNSVSNEANNAEILGNTIRRNVYLSKIRPYLNEDVRNKMEN